MKNKNIITYKKSGVDIKSGDKFVEKIKPLAKMTKLNGAITNLEGFSGIFDLKELKMRDPILIASTDGVGTKLEIARELNTYKWIGIDLVAMCVNDIISQGGKPLFFLDYYATSKLDLNVGIKIMKSIANGCIQSNCSLIGGETAEMPGIYENNKFDLAGFCVGITERENLISKNKVTKGDIILGLESSGIHSNGFSLVRKIIHENNINLKNRLPFNSTSLGQFLLQPTKIYVKSLTKCFKYKNAISGIAHITGGGLILNPPRILPEEYCIKFDMNAFKLPPIFNWLKKIGNIGDYEFLKTFNCGIGMMVIVKPEFSEIIFKELKTTGQNVWKIGKVFPRRKNKVEFKNIKKFFSS